MLIVFLSLGVLSLLSLAFRGINAVSDWRGRREMKRRVYRIFN